MKRSYKLLSMYLDHADMPSNPPDIGVAKDSKDCVDLTEGTTIFDYPVCIRRASGRELLRTNVFEKIQEEIDKLLVCDVIIIDLVLGPGDLGHFGPGKKGQFPAH